MSAFSFHPELFEQRTRVIAVLADRGFEWLSHYSAVDVLHDVYGLEVCGIHEEEDAGAIMEILETIFPNWPRVYMTLREYVSRDPGWKVVISRDEEPERESWETA